MTVDKSCKKETVDQLCTKYTLTAFSEKLFNFVHKAQYRVLSISFFVINILINCNNL